MNDDYEKLHRMSTGIAGLDVITGGGVFQGGLYLLQGTPGTGKTTLANQICFHRAAVGDRALYVTLLAEYHSRMVQYLGQMSFFDPAKLPDDLCYVSAFRVMREEGLAGLLTFMRRELIAKKATLLLVDGLIAAQRIATSDQSFNEFVHELQGIAVSTHCTVFLVASADHDPRTTPEHTMVDGIIELSDQRRDVSTERSLEVTKIRGTAYLRGKHTYKITDDGVVVYPRIESLYPIPSTPRPDDCARTSSGIDQLDSMLGGGVPAGSATMLLGPAGVGKTTLGLQFLSRCTESQPGLLYGFYETPARIAAKADQVCKPAAALLRNGIVTTLWQPPSADSLDVYGDHLLSAVRKHKTRRLFLDGLGALRRAPGGYERLRQFMPALTSELRARGVTSIYTLETAPRLGLHIASPVVDFSGLAENLIALAYLQRDSRLRRVISILKVRDSDFDPTTYEFVLADQVRIAAASLSTDGPAHDDPGTLSAATAVNTPPMD